MLYMDGKIWGRNFKFILINSSNLFGLNDLWIYLNNLHSLYRVGKIHLTIKDLFPKTDKKSPNPDKT